jgi:TfoX/Sxy family transcriptional regulator of competence genes
LAYDEGLAERVRGLLDEQPAVTERRMFGGLAFLVRGHMAVGIVNDDLMVRVGPDAYAEAMRQPHARRMDFTGRPMKGLVFVSPEGLEADADLEGWVRRGLAFTSTLPPKAPSARP